MPNWSETLIEINEELNTNNNKDALDTIRKKYLKKVSVKTGRNVICYYSGWIQKPQNANVSINDKDKSAFMVNIHGMDRSKGLDLILHTPGGDIAATESIVDHLHSMFGNNIRTIVPQISMSAGTMIALSSKEIMLGNQSNLGPIDPQMGGIACEAVLEEFEQAKLDIKENPHSAALWQVIIAKYHPTFLGACRKAIDWSIELAEEWLERNMCKDDNLRVKKILSEFTDHSKNKSHARHISKAKCKSVGVNVIDMEDDNELQDLILTTHHAFMHTFDYSTAIKIVENHLGIAYIEHAQIPRNS
jgi:ClpP class serine protease